jgi:hypothetical protein
METRNRFLYHDSPRPGHGHSSDWITKPYSIVFTAVVLFIMNADSYIRKPLEFNQFTEAMRHLGLYWLLWNESPPLGK